MWQLTISSERIGFSLKCVDNNNTPHTHTQIYIWIISLYSYLTFFEVGLLVEYYEKNLHKKFQGLLYSSV